MAAKLPIVVDHPLVHAPGVFFGLSDDEYHAAFALSASGIKNMRVSTLNFWVESALNPKPERKDTTALRDGRAYDKRIVEGKSAFSALYAPELDPADYPGVLHTKEHLFGALAKHLKRPPLATTKPKLIDMLLEVEPEAQVWERLLADHAAANPGKEFLPFDLFARIEMAAYMIEHDPELGSAFSGGAPQVSVFWTDEETGVPFKARFDYLKPRAVIDLKTTQNVNNLPIRMAVAHAIANYRYHVQAALYLRAAHKARDLAREDLVSFGNGLSLPALAGARAIASALSTREDSFRFLFVVQQKGPAPVTRGRWLHEGYALDNARTEIREATAKFAECWSAFGVDPWVDTAPIDSIDDTEFPAYMNAA